MIDKNSNKESQKTVADRAAKEGSKRAAKDSDTKALKSIARKKLRLPNTLKINVPISQSLMLILPSLAKSTEASDVTDPKASPLQSESEPHSSGLSEVDSNSKDIRDNEKLSGRTETTGDESSQQTTYVEPESTDKQAGATPSHHLAGNMHPQVHYVPALSIPIISQGTTDGLSPPHPSAQTNNTPPTPITYIPETIQGKYGELHVDASGKYTFVLNPNSAEFISLQKGQPGTDPFVLHLSNGAKVIVQIPVIGKQDTPTISGDLKGSVIEDHNVDSNGLLHMDGKVDVVDPDNHESLVVAETDIPGQFGHLSIDSHGHWHYQVNNASTNIQKLAQGAMLYEHFVIHTKDGTPQTIEMTIGGTNDNPVVSHIGSKTVNEGDAQITGQITATDTDQGDIVTFSTAYQHAGFTLNSDGSYTLDPTDPSFNHLALGEHETLIIPVTATDNNNGQSAPQNLIIRIDGTNDKPVVSHMGSKTVNEDDSQISGQITATDIDHGDTATFATTYQHAGFTLNNDGSYTLDPTDPSFNHLAVGEHETLIIPVTATDNNSGQSTPQNLIIRIDGTNDKPVVRHIGSKTVNEGDLQITGQITATDIDHGDTATFSTSYQHAGFSLNSDGSYTLDPTDPSFNHLALGEHETLIIPVTATDNNNGQSVPQNLIIRIDGTNDKPIVNHIGSKTVNEGDAQITGRIVATDVDHGDTATFSTTYQHAGFTLNSDGSYTLDPTDPSFNHLAVGEHETLIIPVTATDNNSGQSAPQNLIIRIDGTNDIPVISHIRSKTVNEGDPQITGQITATDIDHGDTATFSTTYQHAGFTLNSDGSYTLDPTDPSFNHLAVGEHETLIIPVTATDNNNGQRAPQNLIIRIDGTNDLPVFSGISTGNVDEGHGSFGDMSPDYAQPGMAKLGQAGLTADGKLDIVDPDTGESVFDPKGGAWNNSYHGQYGHLLLNTDGTWHYHVAVGSVDWVGNRKTTVGTTIDELGENQTLTDTITVYSKDGTAQDIVITIHGDNDRPYISSEITLTTGTEDTTLTFTKADLLANTVDVDANDAGKLSIVNLLVDHGSVVDNKDGTYTFTPTKDYNGQVHFSYDVTDAHGGATHTGASTTLLAQNDAATLLPAQAVNSVVEDNLKSGTNINELWSGWKNLDVQDVDSPSEAKVTQIEVNGVKHTVPADFAMNLASTHGTFNFTHSTDGHNKWSYSADNSHAEIQGLSHGDSLTDTITLITADGTRIPLTTTIQGIDDHVIIDTPDALTASLGTAVEDKTTTISGTLLAHDADNRDSVTFTAGDKTGAYGTLHVDANGQWHYDLDHAKANLLQQGETKAEGFDITAISTDGSTATKHIEVLVQGTNDTATISVTSNPDVHEDLSGGSVEVISGKLTAVDPDHDQSVFSLDVGKRHDPFNSGVHGGLHISKDGSWTYTVNNSQIQQLAAGQEEHVQYNVHTVGGNSHVIDIKVVGTNDAPTISATTLAHGTEDTHYQMQASQFGFTDIDTGDTLHSVAITDLPSATLGKFVLDGHDVTAGQQIPTADISKLQFVPAQDFNGDVQFKFTVNDGHENSLEATNTLHIDPVADAATIAGVDTGSVTEDSFTGMQWLITKGQLTISDADAGEDKFDPMLHAQNNAGIGYDTKLSGHVLLSRDGSWQYNMDNFSTAVQKLAEGETAIDTVTIHSVDGTPHEIKITITGTNDAPILGVNQTSSTTGTLTETDVDVKDTHTFSVVSSTGQFGSLSVDPNTGDYVYTPNTSITGMSYNSATNTYHGVDVFEVKVSDQHAESSKFITFDASGHVTTSPTGGLVISTAVPQQPVVTPTQPTLPSGTNVAPTNTVTLDLASTSDSGSSSTDNLTNDTSPTITGHTDIPFSKVTIYDGSTPVGHAVSDASGQYSVAVSSLSDGDHNLSAKALAPSSALPATSSLLAVHVDTVVVPLTIGLTHDTGSNSSDLITSDGTLTIGGQEAGATVEYSTDNGQTWTSSFTPQQGSNTVSVRQTDTAGNVSASTSLTFTLDDQIAAPSIDLKSSTDSGASATDDITNIHTPIITGSAEANSSVSITDETGKVIATGTANSNGIYQLTTSNIAEGKHTFTVSSTDAAGNHNSASLPIEVDYTAPTISNVNLRTETTHQPTFSGTVALDTVSVDIVIKDGSTIIETLHATLDGKGGYTVDATNLPDNSYTAYIQATDKAGNATASGYAGTFDRFSVDTQASAPTISFQSTGADNIYNAAEIASGAANTITSTIHLPSDAQPKDTLTINGQSHLITDAEYLAKSVNIEVAPGASITASITDKNSNTSTVTNATAPSSDTTVAPLQVSLTHDTGSDTSDLITNDGTLTITGQEAGAKIEYSIDNGVHWSTQFTPTEGKNNVQVRQTDVAGNVSPSTSLSYTLDTQTDIRINSVSIDQNGPGMFVQVYLPNDSDVTQIEITSDGGGAPLIVDLQTVKRPAPSPSARHPDHQYLEFTNIDLSSLPDGHLTVHVTGQDLAGNTLNTQSTGATGHPLTWDTTASASDDSNTAIEDSTIPVSGNLLSNDADAATVTTTGDIQGTYGVFHLSANGSYTYTLNNHLSVIQQLDSTSSPLVDSIAYTASDNHGNQATAHLAISIQGTDDNLPPAVTGQTVSTNEDTIKTFKTSEFGYSDQDGDALQFVTINSIPSHGLLLLNGKAVITNQQISKADLDAGHLTFTPISNENGANYAQFTFTANDGHQDSASATMIVDVNAVNDAPVVGSSFISSLEDKPHAFTTADFKYSDIDGDALNHLTITNVAHGVLSLNGATVNIGDDVSASDVSSLIFTPTHNYFSSGVNGLGAVQFTANDGQADSKEGSIFINIANVADPATFTGDSIGVAKEDTTLQASGTLTASDPDGTAGFTAVQGGAGIAGSKGYGHAHIDANGHWTYDLDNKHPIVQQLAQGQTVTETITVESADGTPHDIIITITGTNDLPTVSEKPQAGHVVGQHSVDEDSGLNPAGQLIINDVDGDTTTVALDPAHSATYGHIVFDARSGTWVYHLDNNNPAVNALNDNDTLQDKFTLLVDDGHGQKVPQEITMTINGHTDPVPLATLLNPPKISGGAGHQDLHATLGIPPLIHQGTPSLLTGWGISDGHGNSLAQLHGQYGTLHVNPATGELHYDYAANSGVIKTHSGGNLGGSDETDTFVLTLGGSQNSHVEVHLHLHSQSVHGNSGHHIDQTTLTGMDVSPISTVHPAPPPPPPVQHDEPDIASQSDFTVTLSDDSNLDLTQQTHQEPDQKTSQHGAAAYLDALGIKPDATSTTVHDQPADMDIVLAQVDQPDAVTHDQAHLDMSDALEHHDANINHNQDDEHHHHNDVDGLPDIDPNS
ncbi:VCBS domain-containing protein [uncultured Vibrio sp.]|uniref:VCBS domain-containing protein n=1 Tax=uncultured Vibrio sp. TaxID=114054 RepID=UPI0025CEE973|nr:VCBS domain-containing protein [uncultured Vibrio sp.]